MGRFEGHDIPLTLQEGCDAISIGVLQMFNMTLEAAEQTFLHHVCVSSMQSCVLPHVEA